MAKYPFIHVYLIIYRERKELKLFNILTRNRSTYLNKLTKIQPNLKFPSSLTCHSSSHISSAQLSFVPKDSHIGKCRHFHYCKKLYWILQIEKQTNDNLKKYNHNIRSSLPITSKVFLKSIVVYSSLKSWPTSLMHPCVPQIMETLF